MDNQPWLDSVREQLARHNLPPSYVQRFTEELGDHLDDVNEEGMDADAFSRLGEPEQVANAAVVAYRRRSFLGRHPTAAFLVFAISPVIPQYVLWAVLMMVLAIFTGNYQYEQYNLGLSLTIIVCSTFVGILYGELAMRLGIGKKWMLTSFTVLGVMAMLYEYGLNHGTGLHTVRLLAQFAVPLAVGWWFAKRTYNHTHPATTFFIFAISPVVSFMILWLIVALAIPMIGQPLFGPHTSVAVHLVPATVLLALAYAINLLFYVLPTVVASLLYCKLTKGFGSGRKWMIVSSTVLATFAPMLSFRLANNADLPTALMMCIILAQILMPLAIGWWFMRRKHEQGQLELAS